MKTIGERFTYNIKRRIGKSTKEQSRDNKKRINQKIYNRRAELFKEFLGLPRRTSVKGTAEIDECIVNGWRIAPCYGDGRDVWRKRVNQDSALRELHEEIKELNDVRAKACKDLEALHRCLTSHGINRFKAYVRARLDKLSMADQSRMNETDFDCLVSDFLESLRKKSCPL